MKGAIIPAEFPTVSCMPFAVVLFPYRGQIFGSQASGSPTITYNPMATRKHLVNVRVSGCSGPRGLSLPNSKYHLPEIVHSGCRVGNLNPVAHDADGAKHYCEHAPALHMIREIGDEPVRFSTEEVARDGEQLDLGRSPAAQSCNDGW